MKDQQKGARASEIDDSRRKAALAILSSFAGVAVLSACETDAEGVDASLGGPPSDIGAFSQALSIGTVSFETCTDLDANPGPTGARQIAIVAGRDAPGDGGGGVFYWEAATPYPAADGGLVFGAFTTGRWKRIWDGKVVHADWFGVPKDGTNPPGDPSRTRDRLNACLAVTSQTNTVQLSAGTYAINDYLSIPLGKTLQGMAGGDAGLHTGSNSTIILYDGASPKLGPTDCILSVTTGCVLRDLVVMIADGKQITAGVGFLTNGSTTATFSNVGVKVRPKAESATRGKMWYGYLIGAGATQNCDNITVERGFVLNPQRAAFALAGAQPYCMVLNQVRLNNFIGNEEFATSSHGSVFEMLDDPNDPNDQCFIALTINGAEIEYFATLFRNMRGSTISVTVNHVEWEGMKRIWDQPGFAGFATTVDIHGGRFDTLHLNKVVYDWNGAAYLAATDQDYILDRAGTAFTLVGCNIGCGTANVNDRNARIRLNLHNPFTAIGCQFPTTDPVTRLDENGGGMFSSGGTTIYGCRGYSGAGSKPIAPRRGCSNPDGIVTISGATSSGSIVFGPNKMERGHNGLGNGPAYLVSLTPVASTGNPPTGAYHARVANITASGFDVLVEAQPGVENGIANSVTFGYQLHMNPTGLTA